MIKFINNITQIIILLGCCAISIFILFVLIMFIKNVDDLATITNMYDYIHMQNITIKIDTILNKKLITSQDIEGTSFFIIKCKQTIPTGM